MLAWPAVPVPALMETVLPVTGDVVSVRDVSWDHAESAVWVIEGQVRTAVLKAHRQRRKFEQELTAYREWLPAVHGALPAGITTPELLAAREDENNALVLSFVSGEPAEDVVMSAEREQELHRLAGSFLGTLHGLPYADADPLLLEEAYRQRLNAWLERSKGVVPSDVAARVEERFSAALPALAGAHRVRCHRDFTPRNWLASPEGVAIIDFEHSRADWRLADLGRLWTGLWRRRPDLRQAFLSGYGRELTAEEEELLSRFSALGALSTVTWSREHGDVAFERQGWEVLTWLGCTG